MHVHAQRALSWLQSTTIELLTKHLPRLDAQARRSARVSNNFVPRLTASTVCLVDLSEISLARLPFET